MRAVLEKRQSFCRVCMDTLSTHIDFGVFFRNNDSEYLSYMDCFEFVTRIKIDLDSNLQQRLCTECANELKGAFAFIRKAEQAERELQESIENLNLDKLVEEDLLDLVEETISDDKSLNELSSIGGHDSELDSLSVYAESELETQSDDAEILIPTTDQNISIGIQNIDPKECPLNKVEPVGNEVTAPAEEFFCQECNKNFKNHRSLYQHQNRFHQNKKSFEDLEQALGQDSQPEYHCMKCSKTFKSLGLLRTHLKYHERKQLSKKSEACSVCNKRFATAFYLRQHTELVHADKRPQLPCDQCDRFYMTKSALEKHKRIHTGQTVECDECGKSFVNSYELKIHLRFHARDYPFQCKTCDSKFTIKGHLRTHMWQHERLKLQCENCGKLFTSTKALLEHSYTHAEKMPFPCCYCNKSYPSKEKYKVHLRTIHTVEFNQMEHLSTMTTSKLTLRKKNLTLVQADNVMKEIEIESKGSDNTEDIIVEIG